MRRLFGLGLVAGWLTACYNPDKNTRVNPDQVQFATTASSVLFFKNVRQLYYERETNSASKLDLYRIRERRLDPQVAVLSPLIVHNWRHDEAYVLVEKNPFLAATDSLRITWRDTVTQQTGEYLFPNGDKRTHYRFAAQLYGSLQAGHYLHLQTDSGLVALLPGEVYREPFRKSMLDYFRLVGVLQ
ncbi:MAG: hypothetical protein MUC97_19170 [Bernardetiaceae bacterium]|jgi:hypothetical protein|nr:hypothetical protein [Bernardetiaceae bacterium]